MILPSQSRGWVGGRKEKGKHEGEVIRAPSPSYIPGTINVPVHCTGGVSEGRLAANSEAGISILRNQR